MKTYKVLTIITIIVLVAILSIASFIGIYKLKDYRVKNVVPDYLFGKEFTKSRKVELKVDDSTESTKIYDKDGNEVTQQEEGIEYTEENGYTTVETKANDETVLTKENYEKSKKIIVNRMKDIGVEQYSITQNIEDGSINLDITENEDTDEIISSLVSKGTFKLIDNETKEVLLDNSNIKSANVVYGQSDNTTTVVYLQIKFNKEGAKKLEEISKTYIETKVETTNEETGEPEETTESKDVTILIDDNEIRTTHFGDTLNTGILNIPVGSGSDSSTIQQYMKSAREIAILINNGVMPISYTQTNYVQDNSINIWQNKVVIYSITAVGIIAFAFLIIKLKLKGILAGILEIGYIALFLLVLRYTNIKITMEGIVGIAVSIILNYMYIYSSLKNLNLKFGKDITVKFAIKLIPIYIIAIVFTFNTLVNISSLGMTLVWGLIMMYIYNLSLTQITVKVIKD